jgi:hypothetical protein
MRRFALTLSIVLALLGMTTGVTTGVASAESVMAANCMHWQGANSGSIASANYVRDQGDGAATGAVQLCRNGSRYWAYMVLYAPMPSGSWGTAALWQYRNGARIGNWNCGTPPLGPPNGGNDHIIVGQTMCWTQKITEIVASDCFVAYGVVYFGSTFRDSWGQTACV